jgi:hypothetical protein
MPPVELPGNTGENASTQPTNIVPVPAAFVPQSVKAKIGIIYPPPEVRSNNFSFDFLSIKLHLIFFQNRYC